MHKYQKVARQLKETIDQGQLKVGDKVPPVRKMARSEYCSIGTVEKALALLLKQRVLYHEKNRGYFVAEKFNVLGKVNKKNTYLLDSGNPDSDLFYELDLFSGFEVAGARYRKMSRNIPMKGNVSLVNQTVKVLEEAAVYTKSRCVYLCLGTLHGLTILSSLDFPNKSQRILIESPTYSYYVDYLKQGGYDVVTIKRNHDGIDMKELERLFKTEKIKFFYIIPRNHNPQGNSLSLYQRRKIVELAFKYDVYLVEDDYLSGYDGIKKYEPLFYFDNHDRTIYLHSFSKVLPMLRIGVMILPPQLHKVYEEAMAQNYYTTYYTPSLLAQAILENYWRSNAYEAHRYNLSSLTRQKIVKIKQVIKTWRFEGFEYVCPFSGFYSSIKLNEKGDIDRLINNLKKRGVFVKSNRRCFYHESSFDNSFRLSHVNIAVEDIEECYQIIYEELQKEVLLNMKNK